MKPTQAQRNLVKMWVKRWKPRMLLGEWYINIVYMKENHPDGAYAECMASPKYLDAEIRIYPRFWEGYHTRREHTVVHELAHCLTAKVSLMLDDALNGRLNSVKENEYHIEQLTERIANVAYYKRGKI